MDTKFSKRMKDVMSYSREEAVRLGNNYIGLEHFLLGILRDGEGLAVKMLRMLGVDLKKLKAEIENAIKTPNSTPVEMENIPVVKQAEKALKITYLEAKVFHSEEIGTEHLLLAILKDENNLVTHKLALEGVDYQSIKDELGQMLKQERNKSYPESYPDVRSETGSELSGPEKSPFGEGPKKTGETKSKTPVLDNFGIDLTKAADEGRLDPIVGRDKELERIAQVLSRRKKNNPILIGEPGVGKSAIAEGLALRIVQRKVSRALFNKRIVTLDLASLVAGTKYRGQFEERMKAVLNELTKNPDIILFIDEIHTIVGAGNASGSLDASNMFKPALARGELQCIGATTLDEYRQYIEKDGALERRFQKVLVDPTTPEETLHILENIKEKYEDHHLVKYTDEALRACVNLTNRYISDRYLPDKAIDALDEAGARVHISNIHVPAEIINLEKAIEEIRQKKIQSINQQKFEEAAQFRDIERRYSEELVRAKKRWEEDAQLHREIVDEEKVAEVVAMMTGIPVTNIAQSESQRLINMEPELQKEVIGQSDAIKKVVKAIRRNRAGLKDPNKPIGSFIFLGPTGVGKTYLAKMLAKYMFDSEDALIRIDMSEYMEKFAVSRLVGAPPGYVGYEEGGQLTEKVRRKPYSIVLLDEIEKAHPDVFHLLLQVLDDGVLTDSLGRKVDFKNTIIIMTSNIGSRQLKDFGQGVGFSTAAKKQSRASHAHGVIENALKRSFAPEFLNRIDDVVIFESLDKEDIYKIIDIELSKLYGRIQDMGYKIKVTPRAKDFIIEKGWDEQFGARPLKRAIQKYVEDPLAEEIIKSTLKEGDIITVDHNAKKDEIKVKIAPPRKKTKTAKTENKKEE
ncbi:ATP-dependent Clp protease ATP-binding subunit [Candidatus Sulfidibacterium hydrothermale]|uniref:ATP-dependent Clp protease ATP-binding subunit n=1 Tax=Candidatus Sulfidibacterium hydrothermale TaxID=2875962 RepID=UPI001F0B2CF4|nr:AAA family ATPase [Candidatus Sulfidibacterium hydrothermale]UBM61412.1 ATP-dependent Clp protease ATP-binding subunit [Candidatus Sulfidibacterium hydrothermale]